MKNKIIAKNKKHLKKLILDEMSLNGNQCDLNHIDVSQIKNMSDLFRDSEFNGNISEWDVSNVKNMFYMFGESKFNQDISNWDVSNVTNMTSMFAYSKFNSDISKWNTSNVKDMSSMFFSSKFNKNISEWNVSKVKDISDMFTLANFSGDLSNWKPYSLEILEFAFDEEKSNIPYWAKYDNNKDIRDAIKKFELSKQLQVELTDNDIFIKKPKI